VENALAATRRAEALGSDTGRVLAENLGERDLPPAGSLDLM